jgi:hypothetical protein
MSSKCIQVRWNVLWGLTMVSWAAYGCGLKWQVKGPLGGPSAVGPLQIDAQPVDTTTLKRDHPFRWRGSGKAGFLVFDVKITNTGNRDVYCRVGHLDFPGLVATQLVSGPSLEGATPAMACAGGRRLLGPDDFQLSSLEHEKASVLMEDGTRYQVLEYNDFCERYAYLMMQETMRAQAIGCVGFAPYTFGVPRLISSIAQRSATKHMPERLMQAQQMVMRPGVAPAGSVIRGYLVFAWPPHVQPGKLTLRLPLQPGAVATIAFELVERE